MSEIKTKPTDLDVDNFLMSVEPEKDVQCQIIQLKTWGTEFNETD